ALELSDQVVVMHEGRVIQVGPPGVIYDRPATPFVAAFVGNAHVLRGHVQDGRASVASTSLDVGDAHKEGSKVEVFVRPEEVRIVTGETEALGAVALATIQSVTR